MPLGPKNCGQGILIKVEVWHNVTNGFILKNMATVSGIIILNILAAEGGPGSHAAGAVRCKKLAMARGF